MRGGLRVATGLLALVLTATVTVRGPVTAQTPEGVDEIRLLRAAAAREAVGDLAGAETLYRRLLDHLPGSAPGLLGLERVLRTGDRVDEILAPARRFLEAQPTSTVGRRLLLRALADLDRMEAVEREAEAWIAAAPRDPTPYRELAAIWRRRGRTDRAIAALELGTAAIPYAPALDLELGDLEASVGRYDATLRAWDRAVGPDAAGYPQVKRRLLALPDGGILLAPALLDRLTRTDPTPARRRAAVDLAIALGMTHDAETEARRLAADLGGQERREFLLDVGRGAEARGLDRLAYWSYRELVQAGGGRDDPPALRGRMAELALALGDTAAARESYRAIASAAEPGAPERRRAGVLRTGLLTREGSLGEAAEALDVLRDEFPAAEELDGLAATLARALLARDDADRARAVLAGVEGPQCELLRGRMALRDGNIEGARAALMEAAPGLDGPAATDALQLASVLGRLSPTAAARVAEAVPPVGAPTRNAAERLVDGVDLLPDADAAPLLTYAAALADAAGAGDLAMRIRRTVVESFPDAPETPGALLELARALAQDPGGAHEARSLLERLILEYPSSALVPQARRALGHLQGRVPRADQTVP